jgi:3D (Asp-Asp-Asp) domain-containing protein
MRRRANGASVVIGLARVFIVTAYSWGCGATGLTAVTHHEPVPFYTVAVDRHVVHGGAILEMEGPYVNGHRWYAEDTGDARVGGLIIGNHIDLMVANCEQARWWGVRKVRVRVVDIVPPRGDRHTDAEHHRYYKRSHNGLGK